MDIEVDEARCHDIAVGRSAKLPVLRLLVWFGRFSTNVTLICVAVHNASNYKLLRSQMEDTAKGNL